jgi:hypothetical protein
VTPDTLLLNSKGESDLVNGPILSGDFELGNITGQIVGCDCGRHIGDIQRIKAAGFNTGSWGS